MKNLFDPARVTDVKERIARLRPDSPRPRGTMDVAQAVAHCAGSLETALGDDAPMRKSTTTVTGHAVVDDRGLTKEPNRLLAGIDRLAAAGRAGVTTDPHACFGRLTQDEWAVLQHQHLDHHLQQFGV